MAADSLKPSTTFKDIIGLEETKAQLRRNVIMAIEKPELYSSYNTAKSTGILLYGPPGTGKTSITRALAGECSLSIQRLKKENPEKYKDLPDEVPFYIARIPEIMNKFVGETEKAIRDFFAKARLHAPAIIFIDEIDGLGQDSSKLGGEGTSEVMKLAVNTLKQELDGIDKSRDNLFIIGATNEPYQVDMALLRPGRFDVSIYCGPPNYQDRKGLFKYYLKDKPVENIKLKRLARATDLYSQADIRRIAIEATKQVMERASHHGDEVIPIRTKDILKVLKDKNLGKSSLDGWFSRMQSQFGIEINPKTKKLSYKKAKLDENERLTYKDLLNNIESWYYTKQRRNIGRWIAVHVA